MRGNAQQVVEKYLALAREAATAGNPVMAENYYQHAEHYYRVYNASNPGNSGGNDREQPTYQPDGPANGNNGAAEAVAQPVSVAPEPDYGGEPEQDAEGAPEPAAADAPEKPAPRRRRPRTRDTGPAKEPVEQPS